MYGLPDRFDASRLVGRVLELVSFTVNTIHLVFDGEFAITLESKFAHATDCEREECVVQSVPVLESRLMQLLGETVSTATAARDGTLRLQFSNGQSLTCIDDDPHYEAYRLRIGEDEIVV